MYLYHSEILPINIVTHYFSTVLFLWISKWTIPWQHPLCINHHSNKQQLTKYTDMTVFREHCHTLDNEAKVTDHCTSKLQQDRFTMSQTGSYCCSNNQFSNKVKHGRGLVGHIIWLYIIENISELEERSLRWQSCYYITVIL